MTTFQLMRAALFGRPKRHPAPREPIHDIANAPEPAPEVEPEDAPTEPRLVLIEIGSKDDDIENAETVLHDPNDWRPPEGSLVEL
ncbi:MAG: hypothetical protein AAGA48_28725 [Myxococcota bacterium]